MNTKRWYIPIVVILALLLLSACASSAEILEPSLTTTPLLLTKTSTQSPALTLTSIPRWMEYQKALTHEIHRGYPFTEKVLENGMCEWSILGQSEQEVYAWALCEIKATYGKSGGSVPVVIRLSNTGEIVEVVLPGDGVSYKPEDIETLFPPDVQEIIFDYSNLTEYFDPKAAEARLALRWENPSILPLIVQEGAPLP